MVAKKGIAMIELIFALVIIGIVLMSAPMLIQQSIKSSNVALQQEAISAAASQVSIILSMNWDENNSNLAAGVSPILETNRADFLFIVDPLIGSKTPLGLIGVTSRNSEDINITLIPTPIANFGNNKDENETVYTDFDDVDDYHDTSFGLMIFNNEDVSSDVGEYVDIDLNLSTQINYANDSVTLEKNIDINTTDINNINTGTVTNIKFIELHLTSNNTAEELNKSIIMNAFSCNIGTYSIEGKEL